MKLTIKKVDDGSFVGADGTKVKYNWVKGERQDGVMIRFGTMEDYRIGDTFDIDIEEIVFSNGKKGYKESI